MVNTPRLLLTIGVGGSYLWFAYSNPTAAAEGQGPDAPPLAAIYVVASSSASYLGTHVVIDTMSDQVLDTSVIDNPTRALPSFAAGWPAVKQVIKKG